MEDQLDFHWTDIHQLDKMFSMATQAVNTAVQNPSVNTHDDHSSMNTHANNSASNTPIDHHIDAIHSDLNDVSSNSGKLTLNANAATTNILTASVSSAANTSAMETTTPSSTANNDYMLFLNLTTPNSGIDDHIKKDEIDPSSHDIHMKKDDEHSSSAFNFDSLDTSNLDFIMDQRHSSTTAAESNDSASQYPQQQPQQQQQHLSFSGNGNINTSVPPTSQSRSRLNSVEFTPLLSPMINPSLERVNSNKGKLGFSPLSSPVLEFQKYNNVATLRQKRKEHHDNSNNDNLSGATPGGDKISLKFDNSDSRSYKRSKTPVSTPLLSSTDRKTKHGNTTNSSAASSAQSTPYQTYIFKQQQFPSNIASNSNSNSSSASKENSISTSKSSMTTNLEFSNTSFLDAFDGDLTLPPPPMGKLSMSDATSDFIMPTSSYMTLNDDNTDHDMATSATITSLNSTPSVMSTSSASNKKNRNSVLLNPNHHKSAQSSPVILPSSSVTLSPRIDSKLMNQASLLGAASNFSSANSSGIIVPGVSAVGTNILGGGSSQNVNVDINDGDNDDDSKDHHHHHHHHHHSGGGSDKKMSHKLAEQGRRNRMNIAIQELDKMIPESMKRNITVPSKATTVELGCRYIQELLDRLQKGDSGEIGKDIKESSSNSRSDSISPLDALENGDVSNKSV